MMTMMLTLMVKAARLHMYGLILLLKSGAKEHASRK